MSLDIDASIRLHHAESEAHLRAAFPVMRILRPHLTDIEQYVAQIGRQSAQGYRMLLAWREDAAIGLAGYRLQENTVYGRFLYVDDLVVHADARGAGIGASLLRALKEEARARQCRRLVLDTGLAMALAQRFYFSQDLLATGMHFTYILD
jgi:GNAT superfamily N-acetyltransferase